MTAELAQLVPQASLTSAQTNAVIPFLDRTFPPAPQLLKSEIRRSTPAPDEDLQRKRWEGKVLNFSLGFTLRKPTWKE